MKSRAGALLAAVLLLHSSHAVRLPFKASKPNRDAQQVHTHAKIFQQPTLNKLKPTDRTSLALLAYLWPEEKNKLAKIRVVCSILLLISAKALVVQVPFIFKRAVDAISTPTGVAAAGSAALWMVCYAFSRAAYTILQEGRYIAFTTVGQNALRRFMRDAFEHVQTLDAQYLSLQSTGELSRVFARGIRSMNALLRLLVFNVVPTALEATLALHLLGRRYGHSFLGLAMATVFSFVTWTLYVVERRVKLLGRVNTCDNQLFTRLYNALLNNEAVRTNANEEYEVENYDRLLGHAEQLAVKDVSTVSRLNVGQALLFYSGLGCMMALCAGRITSGTLSIGDAVAINALLLQLNAPLTSLGYTYQEIMQANTDLKQMRDLLSVRPSVVSPIDAKPLVPRGGMLRFEDVSFGYTNTTGNIFNVSFQVPAGSKTAIVGSSGSGKSTVLKLALRLHDPDSGNVYVDDQDIRSVDLQSLHRQVAFVPQDTILFDDTLIHNVRYGNLSANEILVTEAVAKVGLNVSALPKGLQSRVGERGLAISGGERQRVSIARALLTPPTLVLCDEPTSALDPITEASVEEVLADAFRNITTVVVAHRLSSVVDADNILVMKNGRIVEEGRHDELLCIPNGTYAFMWAAQTRYGLLDPAGAGVLPPDYCELLDGSELARMAAGEYHEDELSLRGHLRDQWLW